MSDLPEQPDAAREDDDLTTSSASARQVLPYDALRAQATTDQSVTRYAAFAMAILIVVGLIALLHGGLPPGTHAIVLFIVMLAVAIVMIMMIPRSSSREEVQTDLAQPLPPRPRDDRVLDYGRPPERHTGAKVARVAGGFGLLVAGGILGIAAMGGLQAISHDPEIAICGPVLFGVILLFVRKARTFGVGLILSPALAFMIILAICAGFR